MPVSKAYPSLLALFAIAATTSPLCGQTRQERDSETSLVSLFVPRIGVELGVHSGFLVRGSALTTTTAASQSLRTTGAPLLQSAHTAILSAWDAPCLRVDAALSLAYTAMHSSTDMRPLGLLRLSTHRGPLTLSLGLEQSTGVTVSARTSHVDTAESHLSPDTLFGRVDTLGATYTPQSQTRTTAVAELVRASDIVGGLGWNTRYSSIQFLTGVRTNNLQSGPWTGIDAAFYLGESNALTLSARHQSHSATISSPAFSVGFRSSYWHWGKSKPVEDTAPHAAPGRANHPLVFVATEGDTTSLELYLPTAHRAVIMGDATDWNPVEMTQGRDGWWHIPLHITNALSRIQLKTDDTDWRPVPGLPSTRDEYGGTVSLLTTTAHD